jgi:CubicO group peptidase (beta-lactamase class C family)
MYSSIRQVALHPKTLAVGAVAFFSLYAGFELHKYLTIQAQQEREEIRNAKLAEELSQEKPLAHATSRALQAVDQTRQLVNMIKEKQGIPGLTCAVMVDNELFYSETFGFADVEQSVLTKPGKTTILIDGAISSLLRKTLIQLLVDKRKLDLEAPLKSYLEKPSENIDPSKPVREVLDDLSMQDLKALIHKASDVDFDPFIKNKLLDVLELKSTHSNVQQGKIIPYRARSYHREPELVNLKTQNRASGFYTTSEDICKFANALFVYPKQFLSEDGVSQLRSFAVDRTLKSKKLEAVSKSYFVIVDNAPGAASCLVVLPEKRTVVALQANLDQVDLGPLAAEIAIQFSYCHKEAFAAVKNLVRKVVS